jgi:hypothetical protein
MPGGVALDHQDLEGGRERTREQEQVPGRRPDVDPRQERKADHCQACADPDDGRRGLAEEDERKQWREDDVETGDEAGARNGRPLEPRGLKAVRRREQDAEDDAGEGAFPAERPDAASRGHCQHDAGDGEADGEKGEERVELERVLHLDERHAPHRGDRDQEEEREHGRAGYCPRRACRRACSTSRSARGA